MVATAIPILDLISRIYGAAEDKEMWPGVLTALCTRFGAGKSVVINYDFISHDGMRAFDSCPDAYYAELTPRYAPLNPWLRNDEPYRSGNVFLGDGLVPGEELLATEFYEEFLRPQDCFHRLCGVIARAGSNTTFLAIHRPRSAPRFTDADERRLQVLLPHLHGALRLHFEILQHRNRGQVMLDLIHHLPIAILLVDADGRLIIANHRAEEMLARTDGLDLVNRRLAAANCHEHVQLRRLIAGAARPNAVTGAEAGGDLALSRPSGRHPLMLTVVPLGRAIAAGLSPCEDIAVVIAKDPDARAGTGPRTFAALHHLTPAEKRLFALIVDGVRLCEARVRLGISKNTARTHMKRIYAKTDTHRQADLVRLYAVTCLDHD